MRAYLLCTTQWTYGADGRPLGLRYADCLAMLRARRRALGVKRIEPLLRKVQIIETAIVAAIGERLAKKTEDAT